MSQVDLQNYFIRFDLRIRKLFLLQLNLGEKLKAIKIDCFLIHQVNLRVPGYNHLLDSILGLFGLQKIVITGYLFISAPT
tara:strand:+ start:237 stop:476 length:240 start_codon:yes stop_codon:yes gene_type:complete